MVLYKKTQKYLSGCRLKSEASLLAYGIIISMRINKKLIFHYKVWLASVRKRRRLLFPSPAEVEFVRIFGGKYIVLGRIKDPKTGFPLTIIYNLGSILKRELIKREVRVGAMYIDFGSATNYYRKGVEVDGWRFHMDIIKEQQRDDYVARYGWSLLHIPAGDVFRSPQIVQRKVLEYLAR